jgi:hypothetical protein
MKRIFSFILLFALCSLAACDYGNSPADIAGQTAKQYYEWLLQGKYDQFVDGQYRPDSIPASYRAQLVANAKMFMTQQKDEHRGIREIRIMNADADTVRHVANAYLVFTYGDSTNEEVVVPMVQHKGVWYMK